MKQNTRKILTVLLAMLLSIAPFSLETFATNISTIQLPVKITVEGVLPYTAEIYTVRLTSDNATTPMPNAQFGGSYDLQVNGPENVVFPPIEFETVGIYTYTIEQIPGKNQNCRYDTRDYTVRIFVTNADMGEYDITVTLRESEMSSKLNEAEFHDVYENGNDSPLPSKPQDSPNPPDNPPKSDTLHNSIVSTNVIDHWIIYISSSVLLVLVSCWIIWNLRRKEEE